MRHLLRDIPIRSKLTIITLLSSGLALLLACIAFVVCEQFTYRKVLAGRMTATAGIVGDSCAAALTFNEPDGARTALASLHHQPAIAAAAIYDKSGNLFATYKGPTAPANFVPPSVRHNVLEIRSDAGERFRDINLAGESIGTIYLRYNMIDLHDLQRRYAAIAMTVLVAASLLSLLITQRLQRVISEPVSALSDVVGRVSRDKDFTIRAVRRSGDELGHLIDGFNGMLDQIQQRDIMLKIAQDDLEFRVNERTAELANSLAVLNATLDSTADGILAIDSAGKVASYNTHYAVMWGIPAVMLERADAAEMLRLMVTQVAEPERFITELRVQNECRGEPDPQVVALADGRIFERFVRPQRIEGVQVGIVVNYRDVTDRKAAETELVETHKRLVESSRRAGMSEIATNVLHNVGNVLNSVNVSCAVISEGMRKSRISSVARTADLLRRHQGDLAGFFDRDPAGRKLPDFLTILAGRLAAEREAMMEELHLLGRNIGHIKDIVAVQQNYAKNLGGVLETLPLQGLVEDALRMNDCSMVRHGIEIVREFEPSPAIPLEKHKVLQILVNLMRNAKHALMESGRDDMRLTVRIVRHDGGVAVSVSDNGVGIAPENATRIFAHGFTTRQDGHGFGLHSGVLAAREMGGSLTADSAGTGHGATFTLELPVPEQTHAAA